MVRFRFSIVALLTLTLVAAIFLQLFVPWIRGTPPEDRLTWRWLWGRYIRSRDVTIIYHLRSEGSRSNGYSIGYLIRINADPRDLPRNTHPDWFRNVDGRIYVDGRSIPYEEARFQLFIGDLNGPTRAIDLSEDRRAFFRPGGISMNEDGFDVVNELWSEISQE